MRDFDKETLSDLIDDIKGRAEQAISQSDRAECDFIDEIIKGAIDRLVRISMEIRLNQCFSI